MEELESIVQQDIYKIINELKRTTSDEIYYDLVAKLVYLEELVMLKGLYINFPKEYGFEFIKKNVAYKKSAFEKQIYLNAQKYYDYDLKFAKMSDILSKKYAMEKDVVKLSYYPFDKSLELSKKFFKTFDSDINKHFMNIVDSPRFVLVDEYEKFEGWVLSNNYFLDSYTIIVPFNFISDFLSILHETMHSYNNMIIKNSSVKERNMVTVNALYEAPSFFIEHVGLDFLENNYFDKGDLKSLKSTFDTELIYMLSEFKNTLLSGISNFGDYLHNETYSYGRVLSYHFYNNYLKNKDKTLKELKNFMIDYKNYDKEHMLNNYGLNQNDIKNPQKLTKFMDKHLVRLKHE